MRYHFLPEAEAERDWHIDDYESKKTGLGLEFMDEIIYAVGQIIENPLAWTEIDSGMRRRLTDRFPFSIIYHYQETEQEILIVAIMHHRQKPGYWKNRL